MKNPVSRYGRVFSDEHRAKLRAAQLGRIGTTKVPGSSTSAAAVARAGVREVDNENKVWIEGEGWVQWADLERQFHAAWLAWRHRMAMRGVRVMDLAEARQADIERCVARRAEAA